MPTSAPGSSRRDRAHSQIRAGGFTLIELMVVVAIVAIGVAVATLALRDPARERLERDAARLAALLEMARAESRASGWAVQWALVSEVADPGAGSAQRFRFVGVSPGSDGLKADRFLDAGVRVQLIAAGRGVTALRLGPEAVLAPQRVQMALGDARLDVRSDGVEAFEVRDAGAP
jgi:general secretion pathway protein H